MAKHWGEAVNRRVLAQHRLLAAGAGSLIVWYVLQGMAFGQSSDVTVQAIPQAVSVPGKGAAEAHILIENSTADPLQLLNLSWFTTAGVKISAPSTTLPALAPQAAHAWILDVVAGPGVLPGDVQLQVSYERIAGDGVRLPQYRYVSLKVQSGEPESVEHVTDIQIQSTLENLNEHRPGTVHVLIGNKTNVAVTVTSIVPSGPEFIEFEPDRLEQSRQIPAGESEAVPFEVRAKDAVRPGKQLLVFEASFVWQRAGEERRSNIIVSREVNVGVLGESEILAILAVPSLLILPGFLAVMAFQASALYFWKRNALMLDPKSALFWVIAIPISFGLAVLYPFVFRRDFLVAYGLKDFIYIWSLSAGAGMLAFFLFSGVRFTWRRLLHPRPTDDPVTTLRKLKWRWLGLYRERVMVKLGDSKPHAFLIDRPRPGAEGYWVAPRILLRLVPTAPNREALEGQLARSGRIGRLLKTLKTLPASAFEARWDPVSPVGRPLLVKAEAFEGMGRDDLLVVTRTVSKL